MTIDPLPLISFSPFIVEHLQLAYSEILSKKNLFAQNDFEKEVLLKDTSTQNQSFEFL